ncbi:unnamed protein product [Schistosoma curassoni]|uniref:MH2 domain-containing protein n=1 Tax=Schistosoma curassoni TaxID=6186 RepID=A0A183KW96_9TREM|nr:unnamed protein product [Schistosoma curassoni]
MESTADINSHTPPTLGNLTINEEGVSNAIEDLDYIDSPLSSLYSNRFIYWNSSTCSVMTTLHFYTGSGKRPIKGAKLILDAMVNLREEFSLSLCVNALLIVCLIFKRFDRPNSWHEEIAVRLDSHCWIVCRRSNGREVYMVFTIKQESLHKLEAFGCCRRDNIYDDDYTLLDRELMKFYVKLDVLTAAPSVLILKSGLRICSNGAARTNIPIIQDYAYYEVKLQNYRGSWGIGLCTVNVSCLYNFLIHIIFINTLIIKTPVHNMIHYILVIYTTSQQYMTQHICMLFFL